MARERMQQARAHLEAGEYTEAAPLFERMAGVARERGMPRVATHLGARAALCHAHAGDEAAFETWLQHAIADARQDGDQDRSARTFGRLVERLGETPLAERSEAVTAAVRSGVGVTPRAPAGRDAPVNRSLRRHLPAKCGSCGDAVVAEAVTFHEDGSVDCPTCGGLVNG